MKSDILFFNFNRKFETDKVLGDYQARAITDGLDGFTFNPFLRVAKGILEGKGAYLKSFHGENLLLEILAEGEEEAARVLGDSFASFSHIFQNYTSSPNAVVLESWRTEPDGMWRILAHLFAKSFFTSWYDQTLLKVLTSEPVSGSRELLRQADQLIGAVIVTLGRLDQSTYFDLKEIMEGLAQDPVVKVLKAIRASVQSLAGREGLSDLSSDVAGKVRAYQGEATDSPWGETLQACMRQGLLQAMLNQEKPGVSIFETIAQVLQHVVINAPYGNPLVEQNPFGKTLDEVIERSRFLTRVLEAARSILNELGLNRLTLGGLGGGDIFDAELDLAVSSGPGSILARRFERTWTLMEILTHGKVKVGNVGDGRVDPYEDLTGLFTPANKVLAENHGIVQRHQRVAAAEGMLADAYLVEMAGPYLDGLNEGKGATPAEIMGLQRITRIAFGDHLVEAPGREELPPRWKYWYFGLRRKLEMDGARVPYTDQDLRRSVDTLSQSEAKCLYLRGASLMSLIGSHFAILEGQERRPGEPLNRMINQSLESFAAV